MAREYHYTTYWQVEGDVEEVFSIIDDVGSLPQWWPSVYLAIEIVEPGDPNGICKVARLFTKSWLPR